MFLLLMEVILPIPHGLASPCTTRKILSRVFNTPDQTSEWLAKHFQNKKIENFNPDLYFNSLDEFENLKSVGPLPPQPPIDEFERNIAWLDTQTQTGEKLPTVLNIIENGSERQKYRLSQWAKQYSDRKLTEYQVNEAAAELSLILHHTQFNIAELYQHGATELAKKMVRTQYHQHLIEQQLKLAMQESDLLKNENILNLIGRVKNTSPGKWILNAGTNTYTLSNAKSIAHGLILSLPDHQWAKLTAEDLETLFKTGGIHSPHLNEIAAQYKGAVRGQVIYNTIQDATLQISRILLVDLILHKYHQYQERQDRLDKKDHS